MLNDAILEHLIIALIIIVASGLFGKLLKFLFGSVLRKLFLLTKTTLDDRILDVIQSRVVPLSIIGGIYVGIREMRKVLTPEHVTHNQILEYIGIALFLVLVIVLTRLISRIIETTFEWYFSEVARRTDGSVASTFVPLVSRIIDIVLFLIAGVIILDHFGINIGSLLVSLGVGSLAVALAAQETVANMIAGFVILIDQPFRPGDRIRLPSGEEGDSVEIGLRSTRILNYDNNLVVIPNSELVKNLIVNFSFPNRAMRIVVEVSVGHGTELEKVKKILLLLAASHPDVLKEPVPEVFLMACGETGVTFRLACRTADFKKKFAIETTLREQVYAAFAAEGIRIPYPRRIIHVVNPDGPQAPQEK